MATVAYVVGIDIGTSGARALVADISGTVVGQGFAQLAPARADGGRREQDAGLWWDATCIAVRFALAELARAGGEAARVAAVSVDATSGTVVPVDDRLAPLGPGLMYNDGRATDEAARLNRAAREARSSQSFNASYAAAKILWLSAHAPLIGERTACFLHQADFVNARLMDAHAPSDVPTDESNALKTGYDPVGRRWPDWLARAGINVARLPSVVPTGTTIGAVGAEASLRTGLPRGCRVVAGMTDGTAAAVASGAVRFGDANTTLGTTIVWKVLTAHPVFDPEGRLYCHRHPGGGLLPGGASNAGGEGVQSLIAPEDPRAASILDRLGRDLADAAPSGLLSYPLPRPGERFPFVDAGFEGFADPRATDDVARYRAAIEGLACIERWGYEVAASLGATGDGPVWTTGVGARYSRWMQLRADFLGRPVCSAARPESGFGAALVAAMNVWYGGEWEGAARLVTQAVRCEPHIAHRARCDDQYRAFREACDRRRATGVMHG